MYPVRHFAEKRSSQGQFWQRQLPACYLPLLGRQIAVLAHRSFRADQASTDLWLQTANRVGRRQRKGQSIQWLSTLSGYESGNQCRWPLDVLNAIASKEKSHPRRYVALVHYWPARRPITACRAPYTLNRTCKISPSCTTYAFPSTCRSPASLTAASEPYLAKTSYGITSARINPRSRSL